MRKIFLFLISSAILAGLLTACNSSPTKSAESLRSNAKAYGKLIRWKAYEDAVKYIKLRSGEAVVIDSKLLNEIRVTRYEVSSMVLNENSDEAVVMAEISYYHERVNNVHNIKHQQNWWKDKETGAWYLDGQLPPFMR